MNAAPLHKEKLPRRPSPAVANHRVPMLDSPHGAPGSPPAANRLAGLAPHRTPKSTGKVTWRAGGGLTGGALDRLARLTRLAHLPPSGPHLRVAPRRLANLRVGRLPGLIIASGTPLAPPVSPSFSRPLSTPTSPPLSPPSSPCHPCHPSAPRRPPPPRPPRGGPPLPTGTKKVPPSFTLFLFFPFFPFFHAVPIGPLRHHSLPLRVRLLI